MSIEIKVVTQIFKDEDYSTLQNEYNDHKLTKNLAGYRSLHLFYGTARDVIYKNISNCVKLCLTSIQYQKKGFGFTQY